MKSLQILIIKAILDGNKNRTTEEKAEAIFRHVTGLEEAGLLVLQFGQLKSPLFEYIVTEINNSAELKRSFRHLRDQLRDDILERFDNQENWSDKILSDFVQEEFSPSEDVNEYAEYEGIVIDFLDSPEINRI